MRYALLGGWWLLIALLSLWQVLPSGPAPHRPSNVIILSQVLTCPAQVIYSGGFLPFMQQATERQPCVAEGLSDVPR